MITHTRVPPKVKAFPEYADVVTDDGFLDAEVSCAVAMSDDLLEWRISNECIRQAAGVLGIGAAGFLQMLVWVISVALFITYAGTIATLLNLGPEKAAQILEEFNALLQVVQEEAESTSTGATTMIPALLTRMSIRP